MSQSFYEEHLLHIPLEPLDNMLDIECAGGDQLPYLGFVQVRVASSGCGVKEKVVVVCYLWFPIPNIMKGFPYYLEQMCCHVS